MGMLIPASPLGASNNNQWDLELLATQLREAAVLHVGTWAVAYDCKQWWKLAKTLARVVDFPAGPFNKWMCTKPDPNAYALRAPPPASPPPLPPPPPHTNHKPQTTKTNHKHKHKPQPQPQPHPPLRASTT